MCYNTNQMRFVSAISRKVLVSALALSVQVARADIDFASLLFSTDGGRTWREDYPLLTGTNRTFDIKVEWIGRDDRKMVWNGVLHCDLSSARDFASSVGRPHGSSSYVQMSSRHFERFSAQYLNNTPRPYLFHVDLGARAEGARVHPRTQKPLSACSAYGPGTWFFSCSLGYRLETPLPESPHRDKRLIEARRDFFVYIDDPNNSVLPKKPGQRRGSQPKRKNKQP